MSRVILLLATAMIFAANAGAQTYPGPSNANPAPAPAAQSQAAPSPSAHAMNASISPAAVELSAVAEPERALTNLTVYARGVDVGHISRVSLDSAGKVDRVEVSFNNDMPRAWIHADDLRYDPAKRQIVTALSVGVMQKISSMRLKPPTAKEMDDGK
jgi:hypothetical protein